MLRLLLHRLLRFSLGPLRLQVRLLDPGRLFLRRVRPGFLLVLPSLPLLRDLRLPVRIVDDGVLVRPRGLAERVHSGSRVRRLPVLPGRDVHRILLAAVAGNDGCLVLPVLVFLELRVEFTLFTRFSVSVHSVRRFVCFGETSSGGPDGNVGEIAFDTGLLVFYRRSTGRFGIAAIVLVAWAEGDRPAAEGVDRAFVERRSGTGQSAYSETD